MRLSFRKTFLTVLGLAVLSVASQVWFSDMLRTRPRPPPRRVYIKMRQHLLADDSDCHEESCPDVKEGMLNIHLIPHSHVDVGWLRTLEQYYTGEVSQFGDTYCCVQCTLKTTITELLKDRRRRFIFIEMAFLARFWEESNNATRKAIAQLVREKRLEIVTGGWAMSDAAVTYYNDIIDQHTLGFDYLRDILGTCAQSRVAWHVDQFGHSREHAAIFAQMGFDALFIGRIDFEDRRHRQATKRMEFVWETSPNAQDSKGNLFTHITYDGYFVPDGFIIDNINLPEHLWRVTGDQSEYIRDIQRFTRIAQARAAAYRTRHLLLPMGSDCGYREAYYWFASLDKLIKNINVWQINGSNVNVLYSTPRCYALHVNRERLKWEVKRDDFHPYAISPGFYWTGFFTSRCGQKLLIKRAGAVLQACKQLGIFARLQNAYIRTNTLNAVTLAATGLLHVTRQKRLFSGRAMAVMQHHDAITGTETQDVSNDYNFMLTRGINNCHSVMTEAYNVLMKPSNSPEFPDVEMTYCLDLNISRCHITETRSKFLVTAYNPLSRTSPYWIRLPVTKLSIQVEDSMGRQVPFQLLSVPAAVRQLPQRRSHSKVEVVFHAIPPPLGYTSFLVTAKAGGKAPTWTRVQDNIVIENKYLEVTFDMRSGRLHRVKNLATCRTIKLSQDFAVYSAWGEKHRSSGAYLFVPEKPDPTSVRGNDPVNIRLQTGPLVQEVHQQFSPWVSQVIRLYDDSRHLELQWTVGPIPAYDRGKDVVSVFSSNLESGDTFYTDSNGREVLKRRRNHRETWNLTVKDPTSGNYYPVTSRIFIQDAARDVQLTILPDRPQGGSSLHPGTLELMVHRRLLRDDGLGVGEALNETGPDNKGIIYTGKHYLFVDSINSSVSLTRQMALSVHLHPTLTFTRVRPENEAWISKLQKERSFLREALPPNVQVLTLDYTSSNNTSIYLLRLEHIYEAHESQVLSRTATVSLKRLFTPIDILKVKEMALGGNISPHKIRRLRWTTVEGKTNPETVGSSDYQQSISEPFEITLRPMEIRTFRIYVSDGS